ncbi:RNA-directed DNA polymerase from mobile element jockey-like [Brachionus plicatilis]|uniref:RNA-directed DNA polymerase from mobile element jockey-like n=1 Tax=Brachionus plicatilis TaxID=10195 RepID=A0A3M7SNC5_BRAPC|nr:RNA-directed DNA polymerase from mobile element jockey-like [Brachionus plicatilis]
MGEDDSRSALALVDTEKDLGVTFARINEVKWVNPPVLANSLSLTGPARGIKGHARRLSGQASIKCLQRDNTFTNRVVNEWNALPASVVNATSVNQFKNRYDAVRSCTQTTVP